ncbi:TIGR04282 family arsenosugar biosynthesis glycosyltransferase [Thiolapillus sp.]
MSRGSIIIFARAPIPGAAKTRLIPALGKHGTAQLHASLVEHTLSRVCEASPTNAMLWCTPSIQHPFFRYCHNQYGITLHEQKGKDLGARMHHAFSSALHNSSWAILLGTDCPNLSADDLTLAIETMQSGADAVVGPAFDGGYYLLGLRKPAEALFNNMPWGTDEVWNLTRQRLLDLDLEHATIPWQHDLDRPEDLKHFDGLLAGSSDQGVAPMYDSMDGWGRSKRDARAEAEIQCLDASGFRPVPE